jgi:hypothetical protein
MKFTTTHRHLLVRQYMLTATVDVSLVVSLDSTVVPEVSATAPATVAELLQSQKQVLQSQKLHVQFVVHAHMHASSSAAPPAKRLCSPAFRTLKATIIQRPFLFLPTLRFRCVSFLRSPAETDEMFFCMASLHDGTYQSRAFRRRQKSAPLNTKRVFIRYATDRVRRLRHDAREDSDPTAGYLQAARGTIP